MIIKFENWVGGKYEDYSNIEVGDYAIVNKLKGSYDNEQDFKDFLDNTIGEIVYVFDSFNPQKVRVDIKYDYVPDNISNLFDTDKYGAKSLTYHPRFITTTKTRKELETLLKAKKFKLI